MTKVRVGINGFGRIGRCVFKHLLRDEHCEVVAVNDLAPVADLAYLLKYDSVHGWYPEKTESTDTTLEVGGRTIPVSAERSPASIPWSDQGVDVVIESTGAFRGRAEAAAHLEAGAKRVLISAPSDDVDATIVLGVNTDDYDRERHRVISMASCTTNSLAPVAKVLHDRFGIEKLLISTVHAYTASQSLMDKPARHRRRGRAAALSIIPTTTGAAKATALVIPDLEGKMDGMAFRVPVPDGSVTDIVALLGRGTSVDEVNEALSEAAAKPPLEGILRVTEEALVSRDIQGDPHSSIVDAQSTMVLDGNLVKVVAWYDNEWGYSSRLCDFCRVMGEQGF
ncbi:MAG TPA: type I glyceraldehyde-3-phosphate dehydrogenase [Thermoanaerobaculia bacterium]|nr:type I glyceraldehyde-3-phosphate dehydrogenase [Thermoanaerobaculia bacterium]